MVKQENEDFYVGLRDPVTLRKSMLQSVRGMVEILQRLELLKGTRKKKLDAIAHLRQLVKEISNATIQLKNMLPKPSKAMTHELKDFLRIEKKVASVDKQLPPAAAKHEKPASLNKWESELKDIEAELEKLS
ncbi:MAG: hypothetical protein GXP63_07030 [DPANN group archaeon]|nr:hypothetical protein [DPANN group archaeon]